MDCFFSTAITVFWLDPALTEVTSSEIQHAVFQMKVVRWRLLPNIKCTAMIVPQSHLLHPDLVCFGRWWQKNAKEGILQLPYGLI